MYQEPIYPLFAIEREAICWIISDELSRTEREVPVRWQLPKTRWALPAFYRLYPAGNPQGFCVDPVDRVYYDWYVIERLATLSTSDVFAFLDWHIAHHDDRLPFLLNLEALLRQPLVQNHPEWEFDSCYYWLREQRHRQPLPELILDSQEEKVNALTNKQRVALLALDNGFVEHLSEGSHKAIAEVVSAITGMNVTKTADILRARGRNVEDNPFTEKNLQQVCRYLEAKGLDKTKLGVKASLKLTEVRGRKK